MEDSINRTNTISLLFDFYGPLLTTRQSFVLSMYHGENLSLGEIADELQTSRQAVHDLLRRSERLLFKYEQKLGLVQKFQDDRQLWEECMTCLDALNPNPNQRILCERMRTILQKLADVPSEFGLESKEGNSDVSIIE